MKNNHSRRSGMRSRLCSAGVCLAAIYGGAYAAPVLLADGILALTGEIESRGVEAVPGGACQSARDTCSTPITFSSDVLANPEIWAAVRTTQFVSSLWPNRAVVTPDSPRELVRSLFGAGVNDIRLESQFVFSLGAPRIDLAPVGLADKDASPTGNASAALVRSALESRPDDAATRAVPAESSVRLRELIDSMAEPNPIAQKNPKVAEVPAIDFDEAALPRSDSRPDPAEGAKQGRAPEQDGPWKETMKQVTTTLISFVRAVREFVTPNQNP